MRTAATFLLLACSTAFLPASGRSAEYDPLLTAKAKPSQKEWTVVDSERSREIPLRVYLPAGTKPAPVVLFSHGLGGSRKGSSYLGEHWASRGYVAVFLQHPGSDASVWKDKPPAQRMSALRNAASLDNFMLRVKDVPAVLDQLERWNKTESHVLHDRLDLHRIGMSGHSFGALTTQAVSGQTYAFGFKFTDLRIKAAVIMSPSSPRWIVEPEKSFGAVAIPWLLLTGTDDESPLGESTPASRLKVFPALPPLGKYELVLNKAEHSAFGDRPLPGEKHQHNPNHHRAILAVTTAFWDAYLRNDPQAKRWLDGPKVHTVLEPDDRWQKK